MINKWLKRLFKGIELHAPSKIHLDSSTSIARNSILNAKNGAIKMGKNTRLGNASEIVAGKGGVQIKDYTTLYNNSKIIGNITIERYCTLAPNIYISSGNHIAFDQPYFLIKKQDKKIRSQGGNINKPIIIHEDVWIGTGVFISQGITIGRGAIVGANAVVTKDIAPYSVVAGVPAKEIKKRLLFQPYSSIDSSKKEQLPYFYQGYDHWEPFDQIAKKGMCIIDLNQLWITPIQNSYQIELTTTINQSIIIQINDFEIPLEINTSDQIYILNLPEHYLNTIVTVQFHTVIQTVRIKKMYERSN